VAEDIADLGFEVETRGIDKAIKQLDKLDRAEDSVGKTAKKSGGLIDRSMRTASTGINTANKSTAGLTSGLRNIKGLIAGVGFGAAARMTFQYADSLAEVSTLVDTTKFDMEALSKAALQQSRDFGSMPTANVKAFYQAISAGASTVEMATDAMTAANKLAIGGVTDTETAVDGLTTVMNAYDGAAGSFADISDTMFTAVKAGKTTIPELASAIGNLAPIAAQAGGSFEEMMAAVATLTSGGVDTKVAMNGLRGVMASVVKPTKEAQEAAERLGIDFSAAGLKGKGFAEFLKDVKNKTGGSTEELAKLFGGVEALTPIMALAGTQNEKFIGTMEQMRTKAGASEEAFTKMYNSPGFQMKRILSTLTAEFLSLSSSIGDKAVPMLIWIADSIQPVFTKLRGGLDMITTFVTQFQNAFADLDQSPLSKIQFGEIDKGSVAMQRFADVVRIVVNAVSPLIPYLDEFAIALVAIKAASIGAGAIGALVGVFKGIAAAAGLLNPVTLVIAAIAAGALLIYKNWDGIVAWWNGIWPAMQSSGNAFLSWWQNTTFEQKLLDVVDLQVSGAKLVAESLFSVWNTSVLKKHSPEFVVKGMAAAEQLSKDFFHWWETTSMEDKIAQVKAMGIQIAKTSFASAVSWWKASTFEEKELSVKTALLDKAKAAADLFVATWNKYNLTAYTPQFVLTAIEKAQELIEKFRTWWDKPLEKRAAELGYKTVELAMEAIKGFVEYWKGIYNKLAAFELKVDLPDVKALGDSFIADLKQVGRDAIAGFTEGLKEKASGAFAAIKGFGKGVISAVKEVDVFDSNSPSKAFWRIASDVVAGFVGGIDEKGKDGAEAVKKMGQAITRGFTEIRDGIASSIRDSSNIKDAFSNIGDFLKDWLKEKIAYFAANKIMAFVGMGGAGVAGLASQLSGMFSGGGGGAGDAGGLGSLLSAGASKLGGLFGAGSTATAAGLSPGALGGATATATSGLLTSLASAVPQIAIAAATIAVASEAMGGKTKFREGGTEVSVRGGELKAYDFENFTKKRSMFRGTKRTTNYSDVDPQIEAAIQGSLDTLKTNVITTFDSLGGKASGALLDGFEVDSIRLYANTFDADLKQWVTDSTGDAYKYAFDKLGPQVQSLIDDAIDLDTATVEDIAAVFEKIGTSAALMTTSLESVGLKLTGTSDANAAYAIRLTEGLGGTAAAMQTLDLYAREFSTGLVDVDFNTKTQELTKWNKSLSKGTQETALLTGAFKGTFDGMINTRAEAETYIKYLQQQTEAMEKGGIASAASREQMDSLTVAAYSQLEAIVAVEDKQIAQTAALIARSERQALVMNTVSEAATLLNLNFDSTSPKAGKFASDLIEISGGIDAFNAANANYYDTFFSAEEQKQIALTTAATAVQNFNNELGLTGAAAIDTKGEFRTYVEGLDLQTEAGMKAHAAAMEVVSSMGMIVEAEGDVAAIMAQMPENLKTNFADMTAVSAEANAQLLELSATREAANLAEAGRYSERNAASIAQLVQYSNTLDINTEAGKAAYDATSMQIESLRSLNGVTGENTQQIDTSIAALRLYKDSIDGSTEAGSNAKVAIDQQIGSLESLKNQTAINNGVYNESKNALNHIAGAAGAASSSVRGFGTELGRISGVAQSHLNTMNDNVSRLINNYTGPSAADLLKSYNGSHASGIGHIPFDGYRALLHQGESVMPQPVTSWLKGNGFGAMVQPKVAARSSANDSTSDLKAIKDELAQMRKDNEKAAMQNNKGLDTVAIQTNNQTKAINEGNRIGRRTKRQSDL